MFTISCKPSTNTPLHPPATCNHNHQHHPGLSNPLDNFQRQHHSPWCPHSLPQQPLAGDPCRADSQSSLPRQARYREQNKTKQLYARIKGGEGSRGLGERWRYLRGRREPRCVLPVLRRRPQQDSTVSCDKSQVCSSCEGGLQGAILISPVSVWPEMFFSTDQLSNELTAKTSFHSVQLLFLFFFFFYLFICMPTAIALALWNDDKFPWAGNKAYSFDSICFTANTRLRASLVPLWRVKLQAI